MCSHQMGFNFCVRSSPLRETAIRPSYGVVPLEKQLLRVLTGRTYGSGAKGAATPTKNKNKNKEKPRRLKTETLCRACNPLQPRYHTIFGCATPSNRVTIHFFCVCIIATCMFEAKVWHHTGVCLRSHTFGFIFYSILFYHICCCCCFSVGELLVPVDEVLFVGVLKSF